MPNDESDYYYCDCVLAGFVLWPFKQLRDVRETATADLYVHSAIHGF